MVLDRDQKCVAGKSKALKFSFKVCQEQNTRNFKIFTGPAPLLSQDWFAFRQDKLMQVVYLGFRLPKTKPSLNLPEGRAATDARVRWRMA